MTEHYFSKKQTSPIKEKLITITARGTTLDLHSGSGVFSKERLDFGSKLLIETVNIEKGRVLDLGCGIGVVGILLKKSIPSIDISFSDVNERAVALTKKNLRKHKLKAKVTKSDGFEKITEKFDVILFNPPQTAGKKVCFALFEQSMAHLKKGGRLEIVMRRNKGARSYKEKLNEIFGNAETIKKKKGFEIITSYYRSTQDSTLK